MENLSTNEQRQLNEIVHDFFQFSLEKRGVTWTPQLTYETSPENREVCTALRGLAEEFRGKYRENIETLVESMQINNPPHDAASLENGFLSTLDEMIAEGGISWPRIVVSFAFAVEMAYRMEAYMRFTDNPIDMICGWTVSFTARRLMPWIRNNRGWASIVQVNENHEENRLWPNLRNVVGMAGLVGALAIGAIMTTKS